MSYGNKKKILKANYNLFAFVIGCVIALSLYAYSKAQYQDYEFPTGNNYTVGTVGAIENGKESDKWQDKSETKPNQQTKWTETRVATTRATENQGNRNLEKENQGWEQLVLVKGFPEDSQATKIVTYAYKISGGDMDFLMTLKAENGAFDMYKQSQVKDPNWPNGKEDSRWLCQIHRRWYSHIVDNPQFREDYKFQLDRCWELYKWWTKFYWYNNRLKFKNDFTIITK